MSPRNKCVPVTLLLAVLIKMATLNRMSRQVRGGCFQVSQEVPEFRLQGEAVVLRCSKMERVLVKWGLSMAQGYTYNFASANMEPLPLEDNGRVRGLGHRLWFLPAQTTDSGNYTCIFRNTSYCVIGTIFLRVYEKKEPHLDKISYPFHAFPGQNRTIRCPALEDFNSTGQLQWFKESTPIALSMKRTRYYRETNTSLAIRDITPGDEGFYTCELWVFFNSVQYKVTRTIKLHVPVMKKTESTTQSFRTNQSPAGQTNWPKIVHPMNGTIFETSYGSSLQIPCKVFTGIQSADAAEVTWLVDGLPVEESFLSGRAFAEERVNSKNGGNYVMVKLILLELHEEETGATIKCIAQNPGGRQEVIVQLKLEDSISSWLVMGFIGATSFLVVMSLFLYQLLKPQQQKDYILARQNSLR